MPTDHKERAFESAIEHHLLTAGGYLRGEPGDFDRARALDPVQLFAFLDATQPELMEKLRDHHGPGLETALLDGLRAPSFVYSRAGSALAFECLGVVDEPLRCIGATVEKNVLDELFETGFNLFVDC